ncbi:MAG: hypothetical protein PHS57_04660 [Alphaproteobacteria bacterium]|nr:hypothetical protein [Alphaproteobacteria bacterium]
MKRTAVIWMGKLVTAIVVLVVMGGGLGVQAAELPLAPMSPMTGVVFSDMPVRLPVERNFQMAMLTVSSELGRTCGEIEAYGWRMKSNEQSRVNKIFDETVKGLQTLGYSVESEKLKSSSKEITLFSVQRLGENYLFLWSANELGLVLNVCAASVPVAPTHKPKMLMNSVQVFPLPLETKKTPTSVDEKPTVIGFTPRGEWTGSYTCAQGRTGGMLRIDTLRGKDFEGMFKFFPVDDKTSIPEGAYTVYGQYDSETKRILINPGDWIKRPKGFYNTVMVGLFDPLKDTFSAYFEGISGCTSFEARRTFVPVVHKTVEKADTKKEKKKKVVKPKKKATAKKVVKKEAPVVKEKPVAESPAVPQVGGLAVNAPVEPRVEPPADLDALPPPPAPIQAP